MSRKILGKELKMMMNKFEQIGSAIAVKLVYGSNKSSWDVSFNGKTEKEIKQLLKGLLDSSSVDAIIIKIGRKNGKDRNGNDRYRESHTISFSINEFNSQEEYPMNVSNPQNNIQQPVPNNDRVYPQQLDAQTLNGLSKSFNYDNVVNELKECKEDKKRLIEKNEGLKDQLHLKELEIQKKDSQVDRLKEKLEDSKKTVFSKETLDSIVSSVGSVANSVLSNSGNPSQLQGVSPQLNSSEQWFGKLSEEEQVNLHKFSIAFNKLNENDKMEVFKIVNKSNNAN